MEDIVCFFLFAHAIPWKWECGQLGALYQERQVPHYSILLPCLHHDHQYPHLQDNSLDLEDTPSALKPFFFSCKLRIIGVLTVSLKLWDETVYKQLTTLGIHAHVVASVMSNSLRPYGLQPARLFCPWNSPGKNTGVGCYFPLKGIFLTQGLNPCLLHLLHCRQILYRWATGEAPQHYRYFKW